MLRDPHPLLRLPPILDTSFGLPLRRIAEGTSPLFGTLCGARIVAKRLDTILPGFAKAFEFFFESGTHKTLQGGVAGLKETIG
jgi:hypothetical protein